MSGRRLVRLPSVASTCVWVAIALLGAALGSGCGRSDSAPRCEELETWLEGFERQIPRSCEVDRDCRVVAVRPDQPLAAAVEIDDPSLERVLHEYTTHCRPIGVATGNLRAVCEALSEDEIVDGQVVGERRVGRACVLQGTFDVPDVGIDGSGDDAGPDAGPCPCEEEGCPAQGRCIDCACVPPGRCGDECIEVYECGALDELQIGTDPGTCARQCEAALDSDESAWLPFLRCLEAAGTCSARTDCAGAIP